MNKREFAEWFDVTIHQSICIKSIAKITTGNVNIWVEIDLGVHFSISVGMTVKMAELRVPNKTGVAWQVP